MENLPQYFQFENTPFPTFSAEEFTPSHIDSMQCPFPNCGKTFRYKSEKDRHLISHGNTKSFACTHPSCNKSFKRQDALKVHMQSHSEKPQFFCQVPGCSAQFMNAPALKYHTKKHHIEENKTQASSSPSSQECPQFSCLDSPISQRNSNGMGSFARKSLLEDDLSPKPQKFLHKEPHGRSSVLPESSYKLLRDPEILQMFQEKASSGKKDSCFIESLCNKLQFENQELRKKLADQMTSFN